MALMKLCSVGDTSKGELGKFLNTHLIGSIKSKLSKVYIIIRLDGGPIKVSSMHLMG